MNFKVRVLGLVCILLGTAYLSHWNMEHFSSNARSEAITADYYDQAHEGLSNLACIYDFAGGAHTGQYLRYGGGIMLPAAYSLLLLLLGAALLLGKRIGEGLFGLFAVLTLAIFILQLFMSLIFSFESVGRAALLQGIPPSILAVIGGLTLHLSNRSGSLRK